MPKQTERLVAHFQAYRLPATFQWFSCALGKLREADLEEPDGLAGAQMCCRSSFLDELKFHLAADDGGRTTQRREGHTVIVGIE